MYFICQFCFQWIKSAKSEFKSDGTQISRIIEVLFPLNKIQSLIIHKVCALISSEENKTLHGKRIFGKLEGNLLLKGLICR
jgi:hypothetical protein